MKRPSRDFAGLRADHRARTEAPGARAQRRGYSHPPNCVGCPLIHVPYPQQLARKHGRLVHALSQYPQLGAISVAPVIPAPRRLGYRARVKLVVRRQRGAVALGLYVPQSHRVMDISSCPVHPERVNQVVRYLKTKIAELGIAPYDERDDSGDLRYLDLRYSAARREVGLTLVTRHAAFPQAASLARSLMRRFPFLVGVVHNVNESRGNVIWGPIFRTLAGRGTLLDRIGGLKLVFPPGVFSQANPLTAQKLYGRVRALAQLRGRETVLDLYCGVGPIALTLASDAGQVWGIDESELAINTAKQNARRNGVGNCRFSGGDAAGALASVHEAGVRFDVAVMNPPRRGMQPAALSALIALEVPRLIYVSCEPRTLARDLDRLWAAGYRAGALQPFDMFPQTPEVETVAVVEKK